MKKTFLSGLALLGILSADAQVQQQTVNLSTGIFDNYNTVLNTWDIPVTSPDDTWKVILPSSVNPSAAHTPAYVTTGREPNFMSPNNPWDTYNYISPGVRVLAPAIYLNPPAYSGQADGDIKQASFSGQTLYRMTFEFQKTCNTVINNAQIDVNLLTGDGITNISLNGFTLPLPVYPQIFPSNIPSTNYLNIDDAWEAPSSGNWKNRYPTCGPPTPFPYSPYSSCINPVTIPVNPGFLANGTNVIVITMDNTLPSWSPTGVPTSTGRKIQALMIDAKLEISYTQGPQMLYVSGPGSTMANQSTPINITVAGTPASNYLVQVPAVNYTGTGSATVNVAPPVSTTYTIYMTNLTTGCVDKVRWPITVSNPRAGSVSVNSNNSTDLICPGTSGVIALELSSGVPDDYSTRIYKGFSEELVYEGPPAGNVELSPEETTEYVIKTIDPFGDEQITSFEMKVLPAGICDQGNRSQQTLQPEESTTQSSFSISPNPGNGLVQLTVTNSNPKTIEVFDVLGKRVFEKNNITEMQSVIDITAQPKGVYLVKITDGTSVTAKRIIKE